MSSEGQEVKAEVQGVPQVVLENPETHLPIVASYSRVTYMLGILALAAMVMVTLLALRGEVPDTIVLLASTVVTGCISGLVGYVAGQNTVKEQA